MLNPPAISQCSESTCCYLLDMSIWLKTAKITTSATRHNFRENEMWVKRYLGSSSSSVSRTRPQWRFRWLHHRKPIATPSQCGTFSQVGCKSHMVWKVPTHRGIQKSHGNFQSVSFDPIIFYFPASSIHISYRIVITLQS